MSLCLSAHTFLCKIRPTCFYKRLLANICCKVIYSRYMNKSYAVNDVLLSIFDYANTCLAETAMSSKPCICWLSSQQWFLFYISNSNSSVFVFFFRSSFVLPLYIDLTYWEILVEGSMVCDHLDQDQMNINV